MKNYFFISVLICGVSLTGFCQRQPSIRTTIDSLEARIKVNQLKENISLTDEQEQQLFYAERKAIEDRNTIYKQYWRTPYFKRHLAKSEYKKDSIERLILGHEKYLKYRSVLHHTRLMFEDEQKKLYHKRVDSVNRSIRLQSN